MKHVRFVPIVSVMALVVSAALLVGCGAGHPTIRSIAVSPQRANATVNSGKVVFTATATFTDNSSRQLTIADDLTWTTSNGAIATIDDTGAASCRSIGPATITATAPQDLQITVGNGINNTSNKISGTATLACQ
jgi:hypothetical protein